MSLIKRAQCVVLVAFLWVFLSQRIPAELNGVLIVIYAASVVTIGAYFLIKKKADPLTCLAFIFWGSSDISWSINYFILKLDGTTFLAMFGVSALASTALVLFSIALLRFMRTPLIFLNSEPTISRLSFLGVSLLYFFLFYEKLYLSNGLGFTHLFNAIEVYSIAAEYVLMTLAIIVFVASRDLEWTLIASGLVCLSLGDTIMHLDKITKHTEFFDVNSMFVTTGLYLALSAFTFRGKKQPLEPPQLKSPLVRTKFEVLLLCVFFGIIFVALVGDKILVPFVSPLVGAVVLFGTFFTYNRYIADDAEIQIIKKVQSQIDHDIKGPITSLREILKDLNGILPFDEREEMRWALNRISDIVSTPLRQGLGTIEALNETIENDVYIRPILETVVAEVRRRNKTPSINISFTALPNAYQLFIRASESDISRAVSNLMENALKSLTGSGSVEVILSEKEGRALIQIRDNGCGIPDHILPTLGQAGLSYGPKKGSGLGLNQAIETVKHSGGELFISSTEGAGTTITIQFKAQPVPNWFVPSIKLMPEMKVVILDDDITAHKLWMKRLEGIKGIEVSRCLSVREFETTLSKIDDTRNTLFLVDFELLEDQTNGIEVIQRFSIKEQSILATSRFREIKRDCEKMGLGVVPKGLIPEVEILMNGSTLNESGSDLSLVQAVLIDDREEIRSMWERSAKRHGVTLLTLTSVSEFKRCADQISRSTPIYVDFYLDGGADGLCEALYIRDQMGFKSVTISTGADHLGDTKGIEVTDKVPPWSRDEIKTRMGA